MDNSSVKYLRKEFIFLLSSAKEPPLPFKTWFIHVHKPIQLQIFTLNSIYVDYQPTYLGGPPCMDVLCFPSFWVTTCDHAEAIHGQVAQGAFVVAGTKIQNALVELDRFLEAVLQWIPTSTVLKSHQAGKVTSSPWHGDDIEKSHQVVESHIREEESPWHSLFHPYLEM